MAVNASLNVKLAFNQTGSGEFGPPRFEGEVKRLVSLVNGTGANQADILFVDERTVASASNDDLDLAGVLTSAFGATITAAEIVGLVVVNAPLSGANTTNLTIGGATSAVVDISSPAITPGGVVAMISPGAAGLATVTASTADILRIANSSGAAATYQIAILARSA